ncbi:HAD family hydrolase [Bdellovibrio bacteriovorus]|uniref:HAD family hydrolase n=1 Tax=Bdellovibrio bacteriovorus TaxID=959 RepID=UPI0021CE24C0|nr:HAD family hydrolase [Bdellovibrio bacteriovorus]UXR64517.1 HAD family hydrolase [Bdellovibrio bacteriovorus]
MLEQILVNIQDLSHQGKNSLVVFDLDSTLFDVSPRLEKILLDFAASPLNQKRFPEQVALLKNIKTLRSDWGIVGALTRAGLDGHHQDFQDAVRAYWQKSFFSNHYLQFDRPYEGAVEFVNAVEQAGAQIAYLTGRDVERMGASSGEVLEQWGFPLNEQAELVLKPHRSMDDAQFKTDWFLAAEKKNYETIYFFENEPVNLVHLAQHCPKVQMIFFESTHAGKAEPPEDLPRIMNFLLNQKES